MTMSDASMRTLESAEALSLSQPDAFALWVVETLVEDADRVGTVYDCRLRADVIGATLFVSGTASNFGYNPEHLPPAELLKKHIEERFGKGHPLSQALIVWSVEHLGFDPLLSLVQYTPGRTVCASAYACARKSCMTQALERLLGPGADHRRFLTAYARRNSGGESDVSLLMDYDARHIPDYEAALLSSFGMAGWSRPIAGTPKDRPERIASAFAHYAADVVVKAGFSEECTVTVRSSPGCDRIETVEVKLARGDEDFEEGLAREIAGWNLGYEHLYGELKLKSVNLPAALEAGRFGRPPVFGVPVTEAPFVRDSAFFQNHAPIFDRVQTPPDYDCEEKDALEWLFGQMSGDAGELIRGTSLPSFIVYRDDGGAVCEKALDLPSSADIVDERSGVSPGFMDERSTLGIPASKIERIRSGESADDVLSESERDSVVSLIRDDVALAFRYAETDRVWVPSSDEIPLV